MAGTKKHGDAVQTSRKLRTSRLRSGLGRVVDVRILFLQTESSELIDVDSFGGHLENELTFACMKQAYDLGINFFDTAER